MRFSLSFKIIGIAVTVLAFMIAVAVYSVRQTATISEELDRVAGQYLPLFNAVSGIDRQILEQGLVLQRLFTMTDAEENADDVLQGQVRFAELGEQVTRSFRDVEGMLDTMPDRSATKERIAAIARAHQAFEEHGTLLLAIRSAGDHQSFYEMLPTLNAMQDDIDAAVSGVRTHLGQLTDTSVIHVDREEKALLVANIVLTVLATLIGLWFAVTATRVLLRAVKDLVAGTKSVEEGNLGTELVVSSKDEVGDLTRSFNHMTSELRLKERIKDTFGKYMDPRIVSDLLENPELVEAGGEKREVTVMFIDLKGFTSISEKLEPDELIEMLDNFFAHMTTAISNQNGVVDKFMGDAVMAYWARPFCPPDRHAALACHAALEALGHLEMFRSQVRLKLGAQADGLDIDFRIGVSTGDVIIGTIGSQASRSYTVIGDPVNLGSRLEGANKAYGTRIMTSDRTRQLAGEEFQFRELDLIRVKGKREPTRVYELLAASDSVKSDVVAGREQFEAGLRAYRRREWDAAETAFCASMSQRAHDAACQVYLERIAHLRENPPKAGWDGVWTFDSK